MDTGRHFLVGRRGHRWGWWGSEGGSPSCPIQGLTQKKGCRVFVYVSSRRCARTPQHTCHEDLRGQRATLQACAVSTLRWRSEVVDHQNCKDKVKGWACYGCLARACGENVESAGWNCLQGPRHCEPCYWRFSSNAFWQDPARRQATAARLASWVHWGGSSGWTAKAHAGTWTPHNIPVIQRTLKTLQRPEISVQFLQYFLWKACSDSRGKACDKNQQNTICNPIWIFRLFKLAKTLIT